MDPSVVWVQEFLYLIACTHKIDGRDYIARVVNYLAKYRLLSAQELFLILRFVKRNRNPDQQKIVEEFFDNFYCNQWQTFNKNLDFDANPQDMCLNPETMSSGKFFQGKQTIFQGFFKNKKKNYCGREYMNDSENMLIPLIMEDRIYGEWENGLKKGMFLLINRDKQVSELRQYIDDREFGECFTFYSCKELMVQKDATMQFFTIPVLKKEEFDKLKKHVSLREYYRDGLLDGQVIEYVSGQIRKTSLFCCGYLQASETCTYISPSVYYKGGAGNSTTKSWYYREIPDLKWDEDYSYYDNDGYYQEENSHKLIVIVSSDTREGQKKSERVFETLGAGEDSCVLYGITNEILNEDGGISSFLPLNNHNSPKNMILQNYDKTEEINLYRILELLTTDGHLVNVRISSVTLEHGEAWTLGNLTIDSLEFVDCVLKDCVITIGQTKSELEKSQELELTFKNIDKIQKCTLTSVKHPDTKLKKLRIESFD